MLLQQKNQFDLPINIRLNLHMNKYASIYINAFNKVAAPELSDREFYESIDPTAKALPGALGAGAGVVGAIPGSAVGALLGYSMGDKEDKEKGVKGTRLRNAIIGLLAGGGVAGGLGYMTGRGVGNSYVNALVQQNKATGALDILRAQVNLMQAPASLMNKATRALNN